MATLLVDRIQEVVLLHRGLDNSDEDATNDEQVQKILYFHSSSGSMDTQDQLTTATMIESLIELTNKFSKSAIQSVIMHKKSWNFVEVEPSIWLVLSVLNDNQATPVKAGNATNVAVLQGGASMPASQMYTAKGMDSFIRGMYSFYFCFHGSIDGYLTGRETSLLPYEKGNGIGTSKDDADRLSNLEKDAKLHDTEKGWALILEIQKMTKLIRKTLKKIAIGERDLENHQEYIEHYREADGSSDNDHTNLTTINGQNVEEVKRNLLQYASDIIKYEEIVNSLKSQPDYSLDRLKKKLSSFFEWYLSLEELNDISCFAALRAYPLERQCANPTIFPILQLVRKIRGIQRGSGGLDNESAPLIKGCMIGFNGRTIWTDFDRFLTRRVNEFVDRWDATVFYGESSVNRALRVAMEDMARSLYAESKCDYSSLEATQRDKLAKIIKGREDRRQWRSGLLNTQGSYVNLDSFLLYLQHHLATNGDTVPQQYSSTETGTLPKMNQFLDGIPLDNRVRMFFPRVFTDKFVSEDDLTEEDNDADDHQEDDRKSNVGNHEALGRLAIFVFGKLFVACLFSEEAISKLHVENIKQLIEKRGKEMTCRQVKASWIPDHLDRMAKGGDISSPSFSAVSSIEAPVVQIASSDGVIDYPGFRADLFRIQSLYAISKLHKILKSELEADVSSSSNSIGGTFGSSGSSKETGAFRKDPNSMLVVNTPNPTMVRASIHTKSFLEREMKVLGFLPNGTIVRVLPVDQNSPPTLMFYDPTRLGESPLDNYFLNQSEYNTTATMFYNAIAGSFGIAALRSVHDVWMQLTGTNNKTGTEANSLTESCRDKVSADFLCTRISTAQRGGVWTLGKRSLNGQVLLFVINQCATMNEVLEVVDSILDEAASTII